MSEKKNASIRFNYYKVHLIKFFLFLILAGEIIALNSCCSHPTKKSLKELVLSENYHTSYIIVEPGNPTDIDKLAIKELATFLKKSTKANFKIEPPNNAKDSPKRIFIGLSAPALAILGKDPLTEMTDQEHTAKCIGDDIFLYGKGPHGNLYAVYDFLENSVGCRWYSAFGGMKIPCSNSLCLQIFNRNKKPSFTYRYTYPLCFFYRPFAGKFLCRNQLNLGVERIVKGFEKDNKGIVDAMTFMDKGCHTFFVYMPPQEKHMPGANKPLNFLKNKNYFSSNPEFFSMNQKGMRVNNQQVCFSNKELRRELTKNIIQNIDRNNGKGIVHLDANDIPGHFCNCPKCLKLEKKYSTASGPLFDYLIELCDCLKEKYPEVYVKTLAYRKEQSQKPPKINKLPDNLIVVFAPIDDNFIADWSHSSNIETYRDLEQWCKIAKNVWVWYYPNPYSSLYGLPIGNIKRLVNDIRLMKKAGVNGTYFEHDVGVTEGFGFTELQTYLMLKLWQDTNLDANALIKEFTDFQYGKAASMARQYLNELEICRKEIKGHIAWNAKLGSFRYLRNPDKLLHWEKNFDKMENLTKNSPRCRFNIRLLRFPLDMAVLWNWKIASQAYPEYFKNPALLKRRSETTYAKVIEERCARKLKPYMEKRQKAVKEELHRTIFSIENPGKPLPGMFDSVAKKNIRRICPDKGKRQIKDPNASFGIAIDIFKNSADYKAHINKKELTEKPNKPFYFGFGCAPSWGASKPKRSLEISEIKPDVYNFYKLGTVELTPNCRLWLGIDSWLSCTKLERFYEPGVLNKWDVYVSIKFEGPWYSQKSKSKRNRILCDQIVLVKINDEK